MVHVTEPQLTLNKGGEVASTVQAAQVTQATQEGATTAHVHPKDSSSPAYRSGNEQRGGDHGVAEYVGHPGNEVLEEEAQSKGTWFAYVKTKQFWVVLILGQSTSTSF